jgi:hypothetical protein
MKIQECKSPEACQAGRRRYIPAGLTVDIHATGTSFNFINRSGMNFM